MVEQSNDFVLAGKLKYVYDDLGVSASSKADDPFRARQALS
jgi:hypothetical protein